MTDFNSTSSSELSRSDENPPEGFSGDGGALGISKVRQVTGLETVDLGDFALVSVFHFHWHVLSVDSGVATSALLAILLFAQGSVKSARLAAPALLAIFTGYVTRRPEVQHVSACIVLPDIPSSSCSG